MDSASTHLVLSFLLLQVRALRELLYRCRAIGVPLKLSFSFTFLGLRRLWQLSWLWLMPYYIEQINEQKVRKRDHLAILLIKGETEKQRQKEKKQGGEVRGEEKETHSKCDTCITMLLIVVVVSVFIVVMLPLVTFLRCIKNMRINFYKTLNNTFLVH